MLEKEGFVKEVILMEAKKQDVVKKVLIVLKMQLQDLAGAEEVKLNKNILNKII